MFLYHVSNYGQEFFIFFILHPTKLCFRSPYKITLPMQHIWVYSPQICDYAPITLVWSSYYLILFPSHAESNMTIMDHQKFTSVIHTHKFGQGRISVCTLDKSRFISHTSTVQYFPTSSFPIVRSCSHFVLWWNHLSTWPMIHPFVDQWSPWVIHVYSPCHQLGKAYFPRFHLKQAMPSEK